MPTDATANFPADLEDATKWKKVEGVPVFKPHTRVLPEFRDPTGKVWPEIKITVREADLPYIADVTNKAGPLPMTAGHRNPDPSFPEKKQPGIEGWEKNHRVGTFSPDGKTREPCILADLYYRVEKWEEVGPASMPFRSVDYEFQHKRLTGLALLRRRPFLDLGVIPYAHRTATVVQYAFEPGPTNTGATTVEDEDKFTPEEEAQYAKVCRYMAKKHPRLAAYMEGVTGKNAQYAAEVDQLQKRLAAEQSLRLLGDVKGKVKFNEAKELEVLAALPEEKRAGHVQYMMETYEKLCADGKPVPVAGTGNNPTPAAQPKHADGSPAMTQNQMNAAIQYMSSNSGVPYEAAREWALKNVAAQN